SEEQVYFASYLAAGNSSHRRPLNFTCLVLFATLSCQGVIKCYSFPDLNLKNMSKPVSPWDEIPDESVPQNLMAFNQRMLIGFYYFFNRYFHLFFTYAFIKLREQGGSEKIVKDSFTIIWTGKMTFETADDLKYYLLIIVRNKCSRRYHKARKEGKALSPYRYHLGSSTSDLEADKLLLDGLEMALEEFHHLSPKKKSKTLI
ncbi:MAG: hypothetical protein ABUM51_03790, partial [Bacteroidota bacterium]